MSSREGRRGRKQSQATASRARGTPPSSRRSTKERPKPAPPRKARRANVPDATELLAIAVEAAASAASVLKAHVGGLAQLHWEEKAPADYVTSVDRASEEALRAVIRDRMPEARVLGEELTPELAGPRGQSALTGVVFVADPLDGTTNYLHGFPEYAVSIAVLLDGVLTAGAVRHGVTDELYTATLRGGAYRNGRRLNVSRIVEPSRALIGTGFPFSQLDSLETYQPQFAAVASQTAGMRRAGSAALDLARLAAGQFDGFWELKLAPWDIAAGILLVREAGGIVTDLAGHPAAVAHTSIVAGNPAMHGWLLETVRSVVPQTAGSGTRGQGSGTKPRSQRR